VEGGSVPPFTIPQSTTIAKGIRTKISKKKKGVTYTENRTKIKQESGRMQVKAKKEKSPTFVAICVWISVD